ncbi:chemotaxis protein CheW [Leptothoe sp. ISB3NOV94-8A]|uniref:Chemotaxis protein CheW n=1 Tax=Adonisia turfae CCMR0081 TaxID=2292702 RepID=A0A6M0RP86_9CYAN|nr:chemotaxis protein CheW [Adonisia turfae]NEZ58088.1 chemotaxis protein CheW [Adonisia turfae CCMR0081]
MPIPSPLKSRRLRSHKGETTQQVIVFQIQCEWFALPIFTVKKVIPKSDTQGNYPNSGAGLTVYEGKELLILDIAQQIFGHRPNSTSFPAADSTTEPPEATEPSQQKPEEGYLLIIRNRHGDIIGLPVTSSPTVRRFAESEIVPLPANYAVKVNMQCISGLIIQADNQPILFLLNPDQLLHTQPLLPPTT